MLKKIASLFTLTACVLFIAACSRSEDIQTLNQQPIPTGVSSASFVKAVQLAGTRSGWTIVKVKPGMLDGKLNVRDHEIEVNIPYSSNYYSIQYKDSSNMMYDAKMNKIHRNYNKWVIILNRNVQSTLITTAMTK